MGDAMAQRIHDELGVDSMETLVAAAFDGRLATVRGFGPKRLARMQEDLQDKIRSLYDDDRELLLAIRDALLAAGSVRRLRVAKDNLRRLRAYVRETIAERNEKREPLLSVVK